MSKHYLDGCAADSLSNHLKSLGLFRIIATQKDSGITAYWEDEKFVIITKMNEKEIQDFLLKEYRPTPMLNPWSYIKYVKVCNDIGKSKRFESYHNMIDKINCVIDEFCNIPNVKNDIKNEIKNKEKNLKKYKDVKDMENAAIKDVINAEKYDKKKIFLRLCRNKLPDEIIPWLDAAWVLKDDDKLHAPILGTGGNDGNLDMTANFVKRLKLVLADKNIDKSKKWLEASLFGKTVALDKNATIGHNPDGCGGPNSGMGFEGKSISNPWDYILMLEGSLLFAGNIARRQSADTKKAVFPFTAKASNVGYFTASKEDHDLDEKHPTFNGEIWLPLWTNPATFQEIAHIFNEGRVQLGKKQARTGTEFARAIITMGTERGISKFQRFCILKRKGDAYLAINAGIIHTTDELGAYLLTELDAWFSKISKKSGKKEASDSLKQLVRNFDKSVMMFCTTKKSSDLLNVLIMAGKLEIHISKHDTDLHSLQKLSVDWLDRCYDESAEFRLAMSVASIEQTKKVGSIQENIMHVNVNGDKKRSPSCVWKEDDNLLRNMSRILHRRGIDGKIDGLESIPIKGIIPAKISDIIEFLNGGLDIKKINDLILPLSLIKITPETVYPWKDDAKENINIYPLPEAYVIMKLIYPSEKKENIPNDISVLNMLYAKRINDAYAKASYILHAHGLTPLTYSKKTGIVRNIAITDILKERIMASLLFPISDQDRKKLLDIATISH